jgi:hypothetical protein
LQANVFAPAIIGATDLLERIKDINANAGALEKYLRITAAPLTGGSSLFVGGKTPEERQRESDREQAVTNLRNRGQLPQTTPSNMTMRQEAEMELVVLREVAKIERDRAEAKQAALSAQQKLTAETEETAKATSSDKKAAEEKKALMQEIARINLQIKEAQAAGNDALAADLTEFKDLLEAGIKYEGDMEMAARDVNAAYKERLRLKDQEIAAQQRSIEAELKHTETMAFGTDEAKAKAEWMAEYNRRIKEGATEEQARRFANADTFDPEQKQNTISSSGGGNAVGGGGFSAQRKRTAMEALQSRSQNDPSALTAMMRMQNEVNKMQNRAGDFRERGAFASAAREELRANKREERRAQEEMRRQQMMDMFGARNLGDATRTFETDSRKTGMSPDEALRRMGINRRLGEGTRDALNRFFDQQSMPEEQRKSRERSGRMGQEQGDGGKTDKPTGNYATETTLNQLLQEVIKRLPQHIMTAR